MRYIDGSGGVAFFLKNGSLAPLSPENGHSLSIEGTYTGGTSLPFRVTDPQGVVYRFTYRGGAPSTSGYGSSRHYLQTVTWPDGYQITVERSFANETARITVLRDNRGQRAEFVYSTDTLVYGSFGIALEYQRVVAINLFGPGSTGTSTAIGQLTYGYAELDIGPRRRPAIATVRFVPDGSTVALHEVNYRYNLTTFPPLLTGVSDGSKTVAGDIIWKREYAYGDYGVLFGGQLSGIGVIASTGNGGTTPRGYGAIPASNSFYAVGTRGLRTTYTFEYTGGRARIASIIGDASATVLATSETRLYGTDGQRNAKTEANGSRTETIYDALGRITRITRDATGVAPQTTTITWSGTSRFPSVIVSPSMRTEYTYDTAFRVTQQKQIDTLIGSPTLNQERVTTYGYTTLSSGFSVLSSVDGPGLVTPDGVTDITTLTYTSEGRLLTATGTDGNVTTVTAWDAQGLPTRIRQADDLEWYFTYDALGRIISYASTPLNGTPVYSTVTYTNAGEVATLTDRRSGLWQFTYDAADRLTVMTAPDGALTRYQYNLAGDVTRTEFGPSPTITTFSQNQVFDELGRLRQALGAVSQQTTLAYDVEDNLTRSTDATTAFETKSYDALNRIATAVDKGGFTTTLTHDTSDRLKTYTDPRTLVTTFTYNGFGEVISETSADRGTRTYVRDRRGLVKSYTDPRGIITLYQYDNAGRLTLVDYPTGTLPDLTFTYDTTSLTPVTDKGNRGKLARVSGGLVAYQYGFAHLAQGTRLTTRSTYPQARVYNVIENYDREGDLLTLTYPSGAYIEYTRNAAGDVTRIRRKVGSTFTTIASTMTYQPNGPLKSMTYGDFYIQTRTYDQSYRLTGLKDQLGTATPLRNITMGYDTRDNMTAITDLQTTANSQTFGYTPREHLASASGPYGVTTYTYDGVGNRTSFKVGTVTDNYTYPLSSNRLSGITLGAGGARSFTYDAAGNTTLDTRLGTDFGYTYDAAGRMASLSVAGVLRANYLYDHEGRQVSRSVAATGQIIHSVYDSEGRRIAEYSETPGALIREYVWNGWEPVAIIEGGVMYFVRSDHIGRPVFATNSSGAVVWRAAYQPFGGVQTVTGTPPDARFPGQWFQAESGLHQNWMRDYDPTTGRYLQADPLGLIDGASVYGYVRQSPMRFTDPTGEFIPVVVGILLGLIVDAAVDKLEQYCGCDKENQMVPEIPGMWEVYGAYAGGFGGFEPKPRTGVSGGGKSGDWTSSWSKYFGSSHKNPAGAARRAWGRQATKRIPYVGAILGIYDASRIGSCLYSNWTKQ